jgi:N-acetylneuraminic acid mutarotase
MKNLFLLMIVIIIPSSCLFCWEIVNEMPIPVYGGEAVVHNSLIYIIGGYSDSLYNAINLIQIYNPLENSWSIAGQNLNLKRYGHNTCIFADYLYIWGGGFDDSTDLSYSIERWDFSSDLSIFNYNYTLNRRFSTAVLADSDIYLIGGYPNYGPPNQDSSLSYMSKYNIPTNTTISMVDTFPKNWDPRNDLPSGEMSVIINNNTILIFGGYFDGVSNDIYRFYVNDHSYEKIGTILEPRAKGKAVYVNNQLILLIGGYNEKRAALSQIESYNYYTKRSFIQDGASEVLNYPRSELMAALVGNDIYVFGGKDTVGSAVMQVERINISEVSVDELQIKEDEYLTTIPTGFQLNNYPNPFNASTMIEFNLMKKNHIQLDIFSITGKLVKSIISQELNKGSYHFSWDGTDHRNNPVASGIYICKISGDYKCEAKRLLLLR